MSEISIKETSRGEIKTKDRNVWRGGGRKKKRKRERKRETWGLKNGRMGTGGRSLLERS